MNFTESSDAITLESLRKTGATKWADAEPTIGAFVAEMDFGIAPVITGALHDAVARGGFGYMPPGLVGELGVATAAMLKTQYGWSVSASDVRVLPDVIKALEVAIDHLSVPGSKVIVPTPSYMPFLSVPPMHGREVIEVPLGTENGRLGYDLEELQRAFDAGGNLVLLCNPYNPVGRVFEREELLAISELVDRNGGRVFADEIWAPLVYPGHTHIPYASISKIAAGHALTAISASKAWNLPGLKCAQAITSNDKDRAIWEKIGHFAGHGASNLGVVANIAAYRSGRPWLEEALGYLDRNRKALGDFVAQELPGVRYSAPEGTYVGWLDFRDTAAADDPAAFFKARAGVGMTQGTACGQVGAGFARFIFGTPLPIMETAIARMGAALRAA